MQKILGAAIHNLVTWATRHLGFVHSAPVFIFSVHV
jgi:hypothetical protein